MRIEKLPTTFEELQKILEIQKEITYNATLDIVKMFIQKQSDVNWKINLLKVIDSLKIDNGESNSI